MMNGHPPPIAPSSSPGWKAFKIGCVVILAFFLLSLLGFSLLCNFLMKKSDEYEATFTSVKGVFSCDSLIHAAISDSTTTVAYYNATRSYTTLGPSRSRSIQYLNFIAYAPGTVFISQGKKYMLYGGQIHRLQGKAQEADRLRFYCAIDEPAPEISNRVDGLDGRFDEWIESFRKAQCGDHTSTISLREFLYSSSDTVELRAWISNDTIYLTSPM